MGDLPSDHIGALIDVRDSVEEAFNAGDALAKGALGIVTIVEILSHASNINYLL